MALTYELDSGFGGLARLGLIVLSTDETLENEARQVLAGRAVSLLHARIPAQAEVTPEALKTMEAHMQLTAGLLPAGLDVVGYGCTSGATVIGPERVRDMIRDHGRQGEVTNPLTAALAALGRLSAKRIALLTPYVESVNAPLIAAFNKAGIEVVAQASFEQSDDWTVARIPEADTLTAIQSFGARTDIDAVFASCTNLRTFGIVDEAEANVGVPVVSSNLALIWHMLTLAGVSSKPWGPGRLFQVA